MKDPTGDVIECLIDVVNKACQVKCIGKRVFLSHKESLCYENALLLLEELGYVKLITKGENKSLYELTWKQKFIN